jgi:hypothetical protein
MAKKKTEYVFRGTTIGYPGNTASQTLPVTCTSSNPVVALLFALECANSFPDDSVIYLGNMATLSSYQSHANVLAFFEREVIFALKPVDFYALSEGYVTFKEL